MNNVIEFRAIDKLMKGMCIVITGRKIDSGDAEFGRDNRNVRERTLSGLETFAGDILLEVEISA